MEQKRYQCLPRIRREGRGKGLAGRTQRSLGAVEVFYMNVMVDTCHYTFVHTYRGHKNKSKPNINYDFWVIMMC